MSSVAAPRTENPALHAGISVHLPLAKWQLDQAIEIFSKRVCPVMLLMHNTSHFERT